MHLQHRGMLSTAGLFDIIFVSADHFLFYVISMFALNTVYIKRFYDRDLK